MMRYVAIAALLASLGLGGVAWWQYGRAKTLAADNAILRAMNENCNRRVKSILEAQNDAEEVDAWPDLFDAGRRWLLPEAGAAN